MVQKFISYKGSASPYWSIRLCFHRNIALPSTISTSDRSPKSPISRQNVTFPDKMSYLFAACEISLPWGYGRWESVRLIRLLLGFSWVYTLWGVAEPLYMRFPQFSSSEGSKFRPNSAQCGTIVSHNPPPRGGRIYAVLSSTSA